MTDKAKMLGEEPAFPSIKKIYISPMMTCPELNLGCTKRELFAALIMVGYSANSANMENKTKDDAKLSVEAAELLLEALTTEPAPAAPPL